MRVYIIHDPLFNASMSPNGTMRVQSGLFLRVHNEAELGAVLGHEFGHFEMRHGLADLKARRSATNRVAWATILSATATRYGGYRADSVNQMRVDVYGNLRHFNRDQEREADAIGVSYLNQSTLRPQAASQVWMTVMGEQEHSAAARGLSHPDFKGIAFFADHPPEAERAVSLAKLADPAGSNRDDGADGYRKALAPYFAQLLNDQVKLNDFGGSEYLIDVIAAAQGWSADLYFAKGELYRLRGNPRDLVPAIGCYRSAIAADPQAAEAYRGLGIVELKQGLNAEAKESLSKYLALRPQARDSAMIQTIIPKELKSE